MMPLFCRSRWLASAIAAGTVVLGGDLAPEWLASSGVGGQRTGTLVAYEPVSDTCVMPAAEQRAAMREEYAYVQAVNRTANRVANGAAAPVRTIKDPYASFAGVSVDPVRNEVVFTDESLFQVLVYDRLENTPDNAKASRPKRLIVGNKTNIEFQSSVWVDPETGEIYAVNNDTRDTTVIFGAGADGDSAPVRSIQTPHGTFGIAAAEAHDEVLMTIQHDSAVVAYKKTAGEKDSPIRLLQGLGTKLADPHGIAYDPKTDVIYVANFGATHDDQRQGDGPRPTRHYPDELAAGTRPGRARFRHDQQALDQRPSSPCDWKRGAGSCHRGTSHAAELADRHRLRRRESRAVRRQRHGPVDPGVRAKRRRATSRRSAS